MQRAELLAELERLAAEAAVSRAKLAELLGRIQRLKEQLAEPPSEAGGDSTASIGLKVHSAG
jgi:hypothetical protein